MKIKQKHIKYLLVAVVVIAAVAIGLLFFSKLERDTDVAPEGAGTAASRQSQAGEPIQDLPEILAYDEAELMPVENEESYDILYYNGQAYRYNEALTTLLILGVDKYEMTDSNTWFNDAQTDFLLLAVFDHDNRACRLIQINRDTMTDILMSDIYGTPIGYITRQIALAHTYRSGMEDSCENTVDAVTRLFYGIPIDNYFAVSMEAIPVLNDMVGGVTVTVEDDFTGVDDSLVKGQSVRLTSDNVETFVRARSSMKDDPTNLNRMSRQREYMTGLAEAMRQKSRQDSSFALEMYSALGDSLISDCTVDQMTTYAEQFADYTLSEIVTPEGETEKGDRFVEFYVDEEALQQLVLDTFYVPTKDESVE